MKVTQNEGLWKQHFAPLMGLNHALCGDYGYRRVTRAGEGGGGECADVLQYRPSLKSCKIHKKTLVLESLLLINLQVFSLQRYLKRDSSTNVFL